MTPAPQAPTPAFCRLPRSPLSLLCPQLQQGRSLHSLLGAVPLSRTQPRAQAETQPFYRLPSPQRRPGRGSPGAHLLHAQPQPSAEKAGDPGTAPGTAHPKDSLHPGLRASFRRAWEMGHHLVVLRESGWISPRTEQPGYPRRVNLQGGVDHKGGAPRPEPHNSSWPPTPGAGLWHPRGPGGARETAASSPREASAALLTRPPRHFRACRLRVEVLGLGLLAPRHGVRTAPPARPYEWPT